MHRQVNICERERKESKKDREQDSLTGSALNMQALGLLFQIDVSIWLPASPLGDY